MLENLDLDPGLWQFLSHNIKIKTSNYRKRKQSQYFGILFFMSPQRERDCFYVMHILLYVFIQRLIF